MRVMIDAQLPPGLCGWFRERGVEADHIADISEAKHPMPRLPPMPKPAILS